MTKLTKEQKDYIKARKPKFKKLNKTELIDIVINLELSLIELRKNIK
jgi:hypothetical protein